MTQVINRLQIQYPHQQANSDYALPDNNSNHFYTELTRYLNHVNDEAPSYPANIENTAKWLLRTGISTLIGCSFGLITDVIFETTHIEQDKPLLQALIPQTITLLACVSTHGLLEKLFEITNCIQPYPDAVMNENTFLLNS
jgi:hypothetical protein